MNILYYTPPPQEQFNELKRKAIKIWGAYDDTYGYASEKINKIKDLENVGDNFMYIVAMFDPNNQRILSDGLSQEAKKAVADRLRDGGAPDYDNMFLDENI